MTTTQTPARRVGRRTFLAVFAAAALLIAGIVSYAASSSPDGLDSTTLRGCETVVVDGAEQLTGSCIAQHATDHALASSPLADYSVRGIGSTNGIAGVIGVLVTLAVAVGVFWLIASRRSARATSPSDRDH
jgi:cobalt/nickel transport protein